MAAHLVRTGALVAVACLGGELVAQKPNIVFLLAGDLGWTDRAGGKTNGGNGSDYYKTPYPDALAANGMSFDQDYTCGPSFSPLRWTGA